MGPMTRNHQPDQADFRVILPEDIDWKPFPAFPPGGSSGGCRRPPHGTRSLRGQGQGARRHETHAAQASRRSHLHGHVGRFLHRARADLRWRQGEGLSAWKRHRSSRRNLAFPLGEVRRIRHAGLGDRPARARISRRARRSASPARISRSCSPESSDPPKWG